MFSASVSEATVAATPMACRGPILQREPSTSASYCITNMECVYLLTHYLLLSAYKTIVYSSRPNTVHPRMGECCTHFGDSEVQNLDECNVWCELKDGSFRTNNITARNLAFQRCLWRGVDGNGEFEGGPFSARFRFNDLEDVQQNATEGDAPASGIAAKKKPLGTITSAVLGTLLLLALASL